MCIHPRCARKTEFRIKGTELGSRVDVCSIHKEAYLERYPEAKVLILGVDHDPDDRR